ncbi:hypothetical protein H6758_03095 [Candidatus Nomurabacteria bacterium]|nr:hypothetical protein [Candidatus Nomurabacteria bacterium]
MPAKKTPKPKKEAKKESDEKEGKKKTVKKKVQTKSKAKKTPKKASTKKTSSAKKKSSATKAKKTKSKPKLDKKQKENIQITISAVESLVNEYAQKPYEPIDPYADNKKRLNQNFDQYLEAKKNRAVLAVISIFVIMLVGLWMYNFKMVIMKTIGQTPGFGEIAQQSFEQAQSDLSALEPKNTQNNLGDPNEESEIDKAKREIADALSGIITQTSTSTSQTTSTSATTATSTNQQ